VTGASRGLGRAIALSLSSDNRATAGGLHIALLARNGQQLEEVQEEVLARLPPHSSVSSYAGDLTDLQHVEEQLGTLWEYCEQVDVKEVWLINNAGSLSQLSPVAQLEASEVRRALEVNVVAPTMLTAHTLAHWEGKAEAMTVANVSSLAALQPFDCWGLYCMGKAARDMLHRSIALESPLRGSMKVKSLNFAPGPMDTDMQGEIRAAMPSDSAVKQAFVELHAQGQLIDPFLSASKLVDLLATSSFESGSHIDIYELL